MRSTIQSSVGRGGVNDSNDVLAVQRLLNLALTKIGPADRLVEDGIIGEKTITAIVALQTGVVGMANPDGRIDPGGRSWQKLSLLTAGPAAPTASPISRPANVTAFIAQTLPAAEQVKADWGVPVSICLAQAALESGWGESVKDNAYFGIKGKSQSGASTDFTTHEFVAGEKITIQDSFRAYRDFAEAADDYGRFLRSNPRYQDCFTHANDAPAFAESLQAAGYATDPNYADKLKSVIQRYALSEYDA